MADFDFDGDAMVERTGVVCLVAMLTNRQRKFYLTPKTLLLAQKPKINHVGPDMQQQQIVHTASTEASTKMTTDASGSSSSS